MSLALTCGLVLHGHGVQAQVVAAQGGNAAAASARTIRLEPRQQHAIALGYRIARIAVADDTVVDVQPIKGADRQDSLLFRARGLGRTQVLVWSQDRPQPQEWSVEIAADVGALHLSGREGRTLVTGTATDLVTHGQARELAGVTPASNAAGNGNAAGRLVDQSVVRLPNTVQVDVKVVEFNRSDLKEAGINLLATNQRGSFSFGIESQFAPLGPAFEAVAGLMRGNFSLSARLRLMETQGLLRVLAEPSLVALSGQTASFLAGGEVPIPVPSGLGTTSIEYKSFGIGLRMTPTVIGPDRIGLHVAPEASDLDYTNGVTINNVTVPAISTRRTETTVELGDGESFVIGGLVSRTTRSDVRKVPFLGDVPVLGTFFKSMDYRNADKELLIVVTPHLVRPLARGAQVPELPGAGRERPDNVWRDHLLGTMATDATLPGFSQ